jgi:hypothetical protein
MQLWHGVGMWSQGRHFRIAGRDVSRTTSDSFISAYFDIGLPEKQEFVGQILQIMKLNYDSEKVVLLRARWYKNNVKPGRASTTLMEDECGIQRVLAKKFMSNHLLRHEPFVFPSQCNQVFLVPDRLKMDWQLVVDTEVRRPRPRIPPRLEELTVQIPTSQSTEEDDPGYHSPAVESDSEQEPELRLTSAPEETLYPEEIITYKRRPRRPRPLGTEYHTVDDSVDGEIISDEETAPQIEEFPIIET